MSERRTEEGRTGKELESLLQPSLRTDAPAEPLYSIQANFLVAFFGGVYAAAVFCGLNARRMRTLAGDAWILIVAVIAWSAALIWAGSVIGADTVPAWMETAGTAGRTVRYLGRIVAVLLFGLLYLRRRTLFKAQDLAGVEPPSPWVAGLLSVGISIALSFLFVTVGMGSGHV